MLAVELSEEQQGVLDAIMKWRQDPHRKQYLTLGGYAGTGKTTLISYLSEIWPDVAIVAVCGKAVHVLRSKGAESQTIHSLIYVPRKNGTGRVRFRKRQRLEGIQTIVVDEASMIDHVLYADILSFGLPVLFVGDHGQLEPIGTNAKLMVNPTLRLEKIHRQATGNPILRLATAFREGRQVPHWRDRQSRLEIRPQGDFWDCLTPDVQVLCGFNSTRHKVNARIREIVGAGNELVCPGEKLICLRNNRRWNVFNGQQVRVTSVVRESKRVIDLEIETDDGRCLMLPCSRQQFGRDLSEHDRSRDVVQMDYGYCLTVHKAQGSEWSAVLALEEISSGWDARRWRYTAVSRAKDRLVYCT